MNELKKIRDELNKLTWQLDDKYLHEIDCAIDHIEEVLEKMERDNNE